MIDGSDLMLTRFKLRLLTHFLQLHVYLSPGRFKHQLKRLAFCQGLFIFCALQVHFNYCMLFVFCFLLENTFEKALALNDYVACTLLVKEHSYLDCLYKNTYFARLLLQLLELRIAYL
jgi:hypothetical protein